MRGGNWYNGKEFWGHARVANRNPSYYRGPDDPNHAWYHIGFRLARNYLTTTTATGHSDTILPMSFELQQNYPNPFNASTTIRYAISKASFVKLTVFDLLGREVKTLVHQEQSPGQHEVKFDATTLSSGVFLYQLNVNGQIEIKKAINLR